MCVCVKLHNSKSFSFMFIGCNLDTWLLPCRGKILISPRDKEVANFHNFASNCQYVKHYNNFLKILVSIKKYKIWFWNKNNNLYTNIWIASPKYFLILQILTRRSVLTAFKFFISWYMQWVAVTNSNVKKFWKLLFFYMVLNTWKVSKITFDSC